MHCKWPAHCRTDGVAWTRCLFSRRLGLSVILATIITFITPLIASGLFMSFPQRLVMVSRSDLALGHLRIRCLSYSTPGFDRQVTTHPADHTGSSRTVATDRLGFPMRWLVSVRTRHSLAFNDDEVSIIFRPQSFAEGVMLYPHDCFGYPVVLGTTVLLAPLLVNVMLWTVCTWFCLSAYQRTIYPLMLLERAAVVEAR